MAAQRALPASSEAVWMHPPWLVPANVVLIQSNEFCKLTSWAAPNNRRPPRPHTGGECGVPGMLHRDAICLSGRGQQQLQPIRVQQRAVCYL